MIESKKILLTLLAPAIFLAYSSVASAQVAPLSLFGNTLKTVNQSTCYQRAEPNNFTNTVTYNEVCNPKFVDYNSGTSNSAPATYYTTPAPYYTTSAPTYYTTPAPAYYGQPTYMNSIPAYLNSLVNSPSNPYNYYSATNNWYPCDRSGYCNEGLFNTYYRGGPSDFTGYYDYWGNRYGNDIDYTNGYDSLYYTNAYDGEDVANVPVGGFTYNSDPAVGAIYDNATGNYYLNTNHDDSAYDFYYR